LIPKNTHKHRSSHFGSFHLYTVVETVSVRPDWVLEMFLKNGLNWEDHVKKFLLACSGALLLTAACNQSGPGGSTPGSGGSSGGTTSGAAGANSPGSGGNSNPGTAGTVGTGGSSNPGSGGNSNPGSGGNSNPGTAGNSNPGTAGNSNPGTAGSSNPGTAGSSNPGTAGSSGATGTGGRGGTTGTGGSGTGGSGTGGRGGTTGTGGSGTGGSGTGGSGTGGSGTGGAGGCGLTPDCIVGTAPNGLDGYYWEMTPSGSTALSGTNYPFNAPNTSTCASGASWDTTGYINTRPVINVKGTTGQKYTIHINVRGVAGTRCYEQGTALSTTQWVDNGPNNGWYAGGKQYNDSIWNTAEIRVAPKVTGQPMQTLNSGYDIYFANASPNTNPSAAGTAQWWCQREATYEIGYDATFPVMGGGTITLVIHDSNCRTLGNCGPTLSQQTCDTSMSRTISMSGVSPAPTNFTQPRTYTLSGTTYEVQWLWIDVTSVTSP
jgi:hypothetical protein